LDYFIVECAAQYKISGKCMENDAYKGKTLFESEPSISER